jgi:hypothetical protein
MAEHAADISLLISLHDEAEQARPTLLSAVRAREWAASHGFRVELVLAVDRGSPAMHRVVEAFERQPQDQILELDVGDVGASRNASVESCRGRLVAICDGDDLFSQNFLEVGARLLDSDARRLIVRPELVVRFDQDASMGWQMASDDSAFDPRCLLAINPWTTGCMAERSLFQSVPYWVRDPDVPGFGYEDWHWNCETLASGAVNVIAPNTVHYVRIKASGSMNERYTREAALPPPTRLLEMLE